MLLNTDYIYPVELTGYVRQALMDFNLNKFTLSQFLPNETTDDIVYRMLTGGTGLAEAGSYRTWDAESKIGRTQPLSRLYGELPPISQKVRLSEYDRIRSRKLTDEKVREQIFNDADTVADQVATRLEVARGDSIVNGTITLAEAGGAVIDYGRSPTHSVTAATPWTSTTSDILSDLMSWRDTYLATNGVEPGALLGSRRVWNLMLRSQAVRNQVFPGANQPSIVTQTSLNEMFAAQGIPPFTMYQAQVLVNNVATKIIPDNVVVMLPAPVGPNDMGGTQLGATLWGPTSESFEPEYGVTDDEPGIVAGAYKEDDPVALWTKAAAVAIPTLANPNLSFKAVVG